MKKCLCGYGLRMCTSWSELYRTILLLGLPKESKNAIRSSSLLYVVSKWGVIVQGVPGECVETGDDNATALALRDQQCDVQNAVFCEESLGKT